MSTYTPEQVAAAKAFMAADTRRSELAVDEPTMHTEEWRRWYDEAETARITYWDADNECMRVFGHGYDPADMRRIARANR